MPRRVVELEAKALVRLVEEAKALNVVLTAGSGTLKLKCPCGEMILQSIPVLPNLVDRQRGHLKARIGRHLRRDHRLSGETAHIVLKQAFGSE